MAETKTFKTNKRCKNLVGQVFKYLTVLEVIGKTNNGTIIYKCICKCGNEKQTNSNLLNRGVVQSCGCLKEEWIDSKPFQTHGLTKTRIYKIYQDMIARCYKPSSISYKRYGAIGVKVCDRWLEKFENFYEDTKDGYAEHLTLDRYPNGKGELRAFKFPMGNISAAIRE